MQQLKGVYPALVTPFTRSDEINLDVLAQIVDYHIEAGVDGFYVGGTTGEGILQTTDERARVARAVVEQARGRARVIVHVAAPATKDAAALAAQAASIGADVVSSVPPIFFKVPFAGVLEYYRAIANAAGLPMLAYYIPALTGSTFSLREMARLLSLENVIGMKFTGYDLFLMRNIIEQNPASVVMSGEDQIFLPSLVMGVRGCIGATLNFMPKIFIGIHKAYIGGNMAGAQELQYKANRAITIIVAHGTCSAVMAAMKMIGLDCGAPRGPLPELNESECAQMRGELDAIGFFSDPDFGVKR